MIEQIEAWYDDLHLLPGEVGVALLERTEVYERIVFPDLTPEPEVAPEPAETFQGWSKKRLYARAKQIGLSGRSRMTKAMLRRALIQAA